MMTEKERALAIDALGIRDDFGKRMEHIAGAYHHDNMTIRERVQEEIKAIKEYLGAMELLVVNRE